MTLEAIALGMSCQSSPRPRWQHRRTGFQRLGLPAYVIAEKGLDGDDRHLRKAIAYKLVQVLRQWEKRGVVRRLGKDRGAVVWTLKS